MGTQSVPEPSSSIQNDNNPQKIENAPPSLSKSVSFFFLLCKNNIILLSTSGTRSTYYI